MLQSLFENDWSAERIWFVNVAEKRRNSHHIKDCLISGERSRFTLKHAGCPTLHLGTYD